MPFICGESEQGRRKRNASISYIPTFFQPSLLMEGFIFEFYVFGRVKSSVGRFPSLQKDRVFQLHIRSLLLLCLLSLMTRFSVGVGDYIIAIGDKEHVNGDNLPGFGDYPNLEGAHFSISGYFFYWRRSPSIWR